MISVYIVKDLSDVYKTSYYSHYKNSVKVWLSTDSFTFPDEPQFINFYKDLIKVSLCDGDVHVFISNKISQKELGRVEHCFYQYANVRGIGHFIHKLEFLCTPNTPIKKFLIKRC